MPSSEDHPETGLGDRAGKPGAIGERRNDVQEAEEIPREQDYVMVGEDSSREQSSCPTPVGTPFRGMLQGDALHVAVGSADVSPQAAFGSLDPKSLAALQAAFHHSFPGQDDSAEESAEAAVGTAQTENEPSDGGKMEEQPEVTTPPPAKEPKQVQGGEGSPEGIVTPEISPKVTPEPAAPGMKERLEEAQREIERLKRALKDGTEQQEWMLGNVVKSTAAEKEELTNALQAMQDEYNALELELKHHEKEFADLVSEELEARFLRFEEVTLAAVQKLVGIISAPAHGPTGARPEGFAAGMDFSALSSPGGALTAPLGQVAPNMTLLEALQTRQAQDVLSALEAARAPLRHPLDISLQARARIESAVTTLYAGAKRRSRLRSRVGTAFGSAQRSIVRAAKGTAGGLAHSVRRLDKATDRAATAAKSGVKTRTSQAKHAAIDAGCWVHGNMKKEKLGHAMREVPAAAAAPFKAFSALSLHLDCQLRRPEVKQVLRLYWDIALAGFALAGLGMLAMMMSHGAGDVRAQSRTARERRRRRELDLKCKVCDLETFLAIERARAEEAEMVAARAERRLKQAVNEARHAEREAAKASPHEDMLSGAIKDLTSPSEQRHDSSDSDINIWRMEPEELFSWNGFPELDLRGFVKKIRGRFD